MSDEHMAYVARYECGCICAAAVDVPEYQRETNKEIARWLRWKTTIHIERVTCDEVRNSKWGCPLCKPEMVEQEPLL